MSVRSHIWACDPIGSLMFVASMTTLLLALNWAAGDYAWSDPHVAANLAVGLVFFAFFCLYGELVDSDSKWGGKKADRWRI